MSSKRKKQIYRKNLSDGAIRSRIILNGMTENPMFLSLELVKYAKQIMTVTDTSTEPTKQPASFGSAYGELLALLIGNTIDPNCKCDSCLDKRDMMKRAIDLTDEEAMKIIAENF